MDQFNSLQSEKYAHLSVLFKVLRIVIGIAVIVGIVWGYTYYKNISNQHNLLLQGQQTEASTDSDSLLKPIDAVNAFNQNNFDTALEKINTILAQDSKNIAALLLQASILAQRGSIEFKEKEYGVQAIVVAQQVLGIAVSDMDKSEAWRIIGYANEIMERYTEAFAAYDTSIKLNSKNALAISNRGHAYDLNGDRIKAKTDYQQALAIDTTIVHAHLNLGKLFFYEKAYAIAENEFNAVLNTTSNKRFLSEAEYNIGLIKFYKEQDYQQAFSHFNKSVFLDDSFALGWVGVATTKYYLLVKLLANNPTADDGKKLFSGLVDALKDIEKATKINPNQAVAYLMSGKILRTLGEKIQAKGILNYGLTIIDKDITLGDIEKSDMFKSFKDELKNI